MLACPESILLTMLSTHYSNYCNHNLFFSKSIIPTYWQENYDNIKCTSKVCSNARKVHIKYVCSNARKGLRNSMKLVRIWKHIYHAIYICIGNLEWFSMWRWIASQSENMRVLQRNSPLKSCTDWHPFLFTPLTSGDGTSISNKSPICFIAPLRIPWDIYK